MKREKGFTLIELLSVVVVLGITFMFVLPKLVGLISDGEEKEIELIEERVLSAAKDYVNYIDGSFYTKLFKEGDTNYIYKTDLIKSGLLDKEEITKLDTFAGVKGELLEDDKIKYTVEYINAEPEEYTNEELYLMIQNMGGGSSSGGGVNTDDIDDLQSQINENNNEINELKNKNSFLDAYPVGSIFISDTNTNPGTIYGGTWTLIDKHFSRKLTSSLPEFLTFNSTNVSSPTKYAVVSSNVIAMTITFTNEVDLNDTALSIATFDFEALGFTRLNATMRLVGFSDGGNVMIMFGLNYNTGELIVNDIVGADSVAAGETVYVSFEMVIPRDYMIDSACDKFFFKRTA